MSKKPVISKEAEVLLKLLRIALGNKTDYTLPEGVDWKEVVRLSYEHKVSALAVDGLQMTGVDLCEGLSEEKATELKSILLPWFKDVENTEWSYCYYVEVLKTLCQIFKDNGLSPIILKGYGLSLNYPRPSHRGAGDIDVYLVDKNGNPAFEKGDEIAKNILGLEVGYEPHHSFFTFKGIRVENHSEMTNPYFGLPYEDDLIKHIRDLALQTDFSKQQDPFYLPSSTFNGLFLSRHMYGHFYTSSMHYRQIVDWIVFISKHHDEINWDEVLQELETSKMKRFMDGLNGVAIKYLGLKPKYLPQFTFDQKLSDHIAYDIFNPELRETSFKSRLTYYYRSRWKLKFYKNKNWYEPLLRSVYLHVAHPIKYPLISGKANGKR